MIEAITNVWTQMMTVLTGLIASAQDIFWTVGADGGTGSLTFLGTLAVISVAVGVVFLIIGVIQNFLHLRS